MKDERGVYYYPFPHNKGVKMYVQEEKGEICFRLWKSDEPVIWDEHGWVPYDAILQAAASYKSKSDFDPKQSYDIELAKVLIREDMC